MMIPGILIKEYCLMIIPAGFFYFYKDNSERRSLIYFSIISVLSILVFMLVRVFIVSDGGESLFSQYSTQVIYYSKPVLLLIEYNERAFAIFGDTKGCKDVLLNMGGRFNPALKHPVTDEISILIQQSWK